MRPDQIDTWERKVRYEFEDAVRSLLVQMRDQEPGPGDIHLKWTEKAFEE